MKSVVAARIMGVLLIVVPVVIGFVMMGRGARPAVVIEVFYLPTIKSQFLAYGLEVRCSLGENLLAMCASLLSRQLKSRVFSVF